MFKSKTLAAVAAGALILVGAFAGPAIAESTGSNAWAYGPGNSNAGGNGTSDSNAGGIGTNAGGNLNPGDNTNNGGTNTNNSGGNSDTNSAAPNSGNNNSNGVEQSDEKGCNGFENGLRENSDPSWAKYLECYPSDVANISILVVDPNDQRDGLPTDFLTGPHGSGTKINLPELSAPNATFNGWNIGTGCTPTPPLLALINTFTAGIYVYTLPTVTSNTQITVTACWTFPPNQGGGGGTGPTTDPVVDPVLPKTPKELYPEPSLVKEGASLSGANDYVFSPNGKRNGWVLNADTTTKSPWSLTIAGTDSTGLKLAALNTKSQIIFQSTLSNTTVTGTGFKPNSIAKVFLFSTPVELGTVQIDANGNFIGTLPLPTTLVGGVHHIQVTGFSPTDDYRWATVPVFVAERTTLATSKIQFAGDSAVLTTAGKNILNALAKKAEAAKFTALNVYADGFVKPTSASLAFDKALSAARAKTVVAYLRAKGVAATYFANAVGRAAPVNSSRKVNITVTAFKVEE